MKSNMEAKWMDDYEFIFWKRWNEIQNRLHWETYRIGAETNNEDIGLWKKLRRENNNY